MFIRVNRQLLPGRESTALCIRQDDAAFIRAHCAILGAIKMTITITATNAHCPSVQCALVADRQWEKRSRVRFRLALAASLRRTASLYAVSPTACRFPPPMPDRSHEKIKIRPEMIKKMDSILWLQFHTTSHTFVIALTSNARQGTIQPLCQNPIRHCP